MCTHESAHASAPVCYSTGGNNNGPYCQYSGKVSQVYANNYGEILMYFDTPVDLGHVTAAGIGGVSTGQAARYAWTTNSDFAKMLYSSLLAAQARGANVYVQMHGQGSAGYLMIDRIWVQE